MIDLNRIAVLKLGVILAAGALVAAIGHETDVTIAELVADARCATPTQAAMSRMLVAP